MISFSNCTISYDTKIILTIKSLSIPQGRLLPVIGKNGSGKSTLLRAIAGIIPSAGIVSGGRVIYQPQKPYIFNTTCEKNISDAMLKKDREKVKKQLSLAGLNGFNHIKAVTLSGGESARLALARSLINPADIYLIDEPFASADETSALFLAQMLKERCSSINATLLMPIHNIAIAERISADVLLTDAGEVRILPVKEAQLIYRKVILEEIGVC